MLDWTHRLVLRSVSRGDRDDSPALRTLVATGLVEPLDDGYELTAAGRLALDAVPSRRERIAFTVGAVCFLAILGDTVVGWLT